MKRTMRAVIAVGVALMLASPVLSAQGVRLGVGGGLLMPLGDYKTADKMGWVAGVDGTYWLATAPLGIRAELSYSQTSHKNGIGGSSKIIGGMADLVYAFGTKAMPLRPYVLAGLGYYNVKVDVTGVGSNSESKLGFGAGAGLAYKVGTSGTRLFLEAKWTSVSTSGSSTSFIPIKVGLRFALK